MTLFPLPPSGPAASWLQDLPQKLESSSLHYVEQLRKTLQTRVPRTRVSPAQWAQPFSEARARLGQFLIQRPPPPNRVLPPPPPDARSSARVKRELAGGWKALPRGNRRAVVSNLGPSGLAGSWVAGSVTAAAAAAEAAWGSRKEAERHHQKRQRAEAKEAERLEEAKS